MRSPALSPPKVMGAGEENKQRLFICHGDLNLKLFGLSGFVIRNSLRIKYPFTSIFFEYK